MSLPTAVRASNILLPTTNRSAFHTSAPSRASILFALGALSNSRETQHFNKASGLSRVEHSPPLKLIQSSEVDPFPLPAPTPPSAPSTAWQARSASPAWDSRALQIGRAMLTEQARRTHRLQRALESARRREVRRETAVGRERMAWEAERQKLRGEMRAAGVWILASIGTATALATWRFWPGAREAEGDLGRRIAAAAAVPLPAAVVEEPVVVEASPVQQVMAEVDPPTRSSRPSWWKGLFWKQE